MGFESVFRVPTDEYRFTGANISVNSGEKVYIDPSTWCIHGEYKDFEKCIAAKSNVTAHLAQIHPFTLGWLADLHTFSTLTEVTLKQINRVALCNPTLTILGGDIVFGPSQEHIQSFGKVWDYVKNKLSNNLWLKGNHDVSPDFHYYYDWFERMWSIRMGAFKFIGFDTYNEQNTMAHSCWPYLSLPDVIWLKKRLTEDKLNKVILAHHPLDQWHRYAPLAFEEALNLKYVLGGHDPEVVHTKSKNIPMYVNGTCTEGVEWQVATINAFMKDGSTYSILIDDDIEIKDGSDNIKITTPRVMGWDKERIEAKIPIRLVKHINNHYLSFIVNCPSENTTSINIIRNKNQSIKVVSDTETYVIGKGIYSEEASYDCWKCSCGAMWNSYYIKDGQKIELGFRE